MTRQQVWQQPPAPDRDYQGFPRRTVKAGSVWCREHDAAKDRGGSPPARTVAEVETAIAVVDPPDDDQVTILDTP